MEFRSCCRGGAWFATTRRSPSRESRSSGSSAPCGARRAPATARDSASSSSPRTRGEREIARLAGSGWATHEELEPWLESAPVHVFVCVREADYHERYQQADKLVDGDEIEWPVPFWFVDAGAALMLILLAAIDEGLAAGLSGVPRSSPIGSGRTSFGIPDDVRSSRS